ncbi:MAG TPA: Ig-like domain-containing protein, partial [Anaerolineales bacterium]
MKTTRITKTIFFAAVILLFSAACGRSQPQPTTAPREATSAALQTRAPASTGPAATSPAANPTPGPTATASLLKNDSGVLLAPKVISQSPAPQEEAGLTSDFEVGFDQPMDQAATSDAWQVTDAKGKPVEGNISWPTPRTLRFSPSQPLLPASEYKAILQVKAASTSGAKITDPVSFTFDTIGEIQVGQVSPANGTTEVDNKALITVIFNRPVVPLGIAEDQSK